MATKSKNSIKKLPKAFVLDTNVILHDADSINMFQENDVIIPLTVIEELDHFKRGSQVINLNAREFARTLDSMTGSPCLMAESRWVKEGVNFELQF